MPGWIASPRIACRYRKLDDAGYLKKEHTLGFAYSIAHAAVSGYSRAVGRHSRVWSTRAAFVLVDAHQANPAYPNIFGNRCVRGHRASRKNSGTHRGCPKPAS